MLFVIFSFGFVTWAVNFDPPAVLIFSVATIILMLPAMFLHIEYFLVNKTQSIHLSAEGVVLQTIDKKITHYPITELEKIIVYQSGNMEEGGRPRLPIEFYFYVKILTRNTKEPIIITSLMLSKSLEEITVLKGIPIEIKRTFFASIRYPLVLPVPKLFGN
jgi:hypothetical protein